MSELKDRIVAIIDLEYFGHKKYLSFRELGICNRSYRKVINHQVYPKSLPIYDLHAKKTFNFAKYYCHGLSFFPTKKYVHEKEVEEIVKKFYQEEATDENSVLAYKGGTIERDFLRRLNIPSVNLETIPGCPHRSKLDITMPAVDYYCNNHIYTKDGFKHCATVECVFYMLWLNSL